MNPASIRAALAALRSDDPLARSTIVVRSALEAEAMKRALAVSDAAPLSPTGHGVAGVEVMRWVDVADRVVTVGTDALVRAATIDEVVSTGVVPALDALADDAAHAEWLRLSAASPASWRRLASVLISASLATRSSDEPLAIAAHEELGALRSVAADAEAHLAKANLVLPGRLVNRAADVVQESPGLLARALGTVLVIEAPDEGDGRAVMGLHHALDAADVLVQLPERADAADGPMDIRVVLTPDAHAEARVVADQVHRWLLGHNGTQAVDYQDVAVVTPMSVAYQSLISHELTVRGIPSWANLRLTTLASSPAGRLTTALARALDRASGCALCAVQTPGHDCTGEFADVADVARIVMRAPADEPGAWSSIANEVLDPARALELTAGLRNWLVLIDWLLGDDAALAAVTRRNQLARESNTPRDVVRRSCDDPAQHPRVEPFLRILQRALLPAAEPSASVLADRLVELDRDLRAQGRRIERLAVIAKRLQAQGSEPAASFAELAEVAVAASTEPPGKPGSGVMIVSVDQVAAVTATRIAWCGMAEGLCPPTMVEERLVDGDEKAAQARRARLDQAAAAVHQAAAASLITCPRVRIGERSAEVASTWLLRWAGIRGMGAAELLEQTASDAASITSDCARLEILDSSLEAAARYPSADEQQQTAAVGAADRMVERLAEWDLAEPSVADGLIGARNDGTWLNARRDPEREISPSRVKDFVSCPRRFFLATIVGLKAIDDPDEPVPANAWGSLVHDALQSSWTQLRATPEPARAAMLQRTIEDEFPARLPFVVIDEGLRQRIERQARSTVRIVEPALARPDEPKTEQELSGVINGIRLRGFADFLWPDLVADLKTGQAKNQADSAPDRGQVAIYAQLVHDNAQTVNGDLPRAELWYATASAREKKSAIVPADQGEGPHIHERQMAALSTALTTGFFPGRGDPTASEDKTCKYCDFTSVCDPSTGTRWSLIADSDLAQSINADESAQGKS